MHKQVRALDAHTDNTSQEPYIAVRPFSVFFRSKRLARVVSISFDLLLHEGQASHVAPQLSLRVRRHGSTLRRAQSFQLLQGFGEGRPESANSETGETSLHSVDDARLLLDQALALAARPLGVLIFDGGNRSHAAVLRLTAQPTEKGALE